MIGGDLPRVRISSAIRRLLFLILTSRCCKVIFISGCRRECVHYIRVLLIAVKATSRLFYYASHPVACDPALLYSRHPWLYEQDGLAE